MAKLILSATGSSLKFSSLEIKNVLNKWNLTPVISSYKFYTWVEVPDGNDSSKHVAHAASYKGRYYEIPIDKLGL